MWEDKTVGDMIRGSAAAHMGVRDGSAINGLILANKERQKNFEAERRRNKELCKRYDNQKTNIATHIGTKGGSDDGANTVWFWVGIALLIIANL